MFWTHSLTATQIQNICHNVTVCEQLKGVRYSHFWQERPSVTERGIEKITRWRNPFDRGAANNCAQFWLSGSRSEKIDFHKLKESDMKEFWDELDNNGIEEGKSKDIFQGWTIEASRWVARIFEKFSLGKSELSRLGEWIIAKFSVRCQVLFSRKPEPCEPATARSEHASIKLPQSSSCAMRSSANSRSSKHSRPSSPDAVQTPQESLQEFFEQRAPNCYSF